ncbi:hypothetical protein J2P12_08940, partial [Candidatus Bathyarchaeota archaeon]|nr:hypothetical protein [Candidatus Bathyarchaeota archaeon]
VSGVNGNVTYAYRSASGSSYTYFLNILLNPSRCPTITSDLSTNTVYALAVQGSSIVMKRKPLAGNWSDQSLVYPVTGRMNPANLTSNFASASSTNASQILLEWTERVANQYNATFASIPIQTVWSPYGVPDPWNGYGTAPYGQYFNNLGESVSPSTGLLTLQQTPLTVTGRGLSLDFTLVYT